MPPNGSTEVRVALVLNGGVSLAVWMSGVVREVDVICRASSGQKLPADANEAERRHYEAWRGITREAGKRIVVDIIAGTSAGGLNGTILGTALACGKPLPNLKATWNRSAQLEQDALLWKKGTDPVPSVLNGDYFEKTVDEVLRGLCTTPRPVDRDVTLFVTATALGLSDLRYRDSAGEVFDVADHRRLYRFRTAEVYRFHPDTGTFDRSRENDFTDTPNGADALVCGARASAGFPGAFAPIKETDALAERRHPPAPPAAEDEPPGTTYLVDGGILDNAPIEPVIEEIGRRTVDGRIQRVLAYVVPSNGTVARSELAKTDRSKETDTAPKWTSVVGAALDLPREADFRHDIAGLIEALGSDRTRVTTSVALLDRAFEATDGSTERAGIAAAATTLLAPYRVNRIEGSLRDIRTGLAERSLAPPQLRTPSSPTLNHAGVTAVWVPNGPPADDVWTADPWEFGFSGALRTVRVLLSATRAQIEHDPDTFSPLATQLGDIRNRIAAVQEEVVKPLYQAVRDIPTNIEPQQWDTEVIAKVNKVFGDLQATGLLTAQIDETVTAYADRCGLDAATLGQTLVGIEIVTGAVSGRSEDQAPPPFEFLRIGPDITSALYPEPAKLGADKLYGTRLQHFGAFGHADWRDRDFTWGRLDAAAHVAKLLNVDPARASELEQQVVEAEWTDPTKFPDGFSDVARTNTQILDQLRTSKDGREALQGVGDSVLRFLAQPDTPVTMPPVMLRAALGKWTWPGWNLGDVVSWLAGRSVRRRFQGWIRTGSFGSLPLGRQTSSKPPRG